MEDFSVLPEQHRVSRDNKTRRKTKEIGLVL
jgi:hypothetical protein